MNISFLPVESLRFLFPISFIFWIAYGKQQKHINSNVFLKLFAALIYCLIFLNLLLVLDIYLSGVGLSFFSREGLAGPFIEYFFSPLISILGALHFAIYKNQISSKRILLLPFLIAIAISLPTIYDGIYLPLIILGILISAASTGIFGFFAAIEIYGFFKRK